MHGLWLLPPLVFVLVVAFAVLDEVRRLREHACGERADVRTGCWLIAGIVIYTALVRFLP